MKKKPLVVTIVDGSNEMESIPDVSKIVGDNTGIQYSFINQYLSFLVEFVKKIEKPNPITNTIVKEKAEKSVALTLVDLQHYQTVFKSLKMLYNYYFKNSLMSYLNNHLINELSNLISKMYSSEYWKKVALDALNLCPRTFPEVYFDVTPIRKSTPWLSPEITKKRRYI